ncbi:type V toxin-antitoxin system endoribonuclease antitoxin GhoS [Cronobacter dublinensis]|uniref:type V toxin-antitoxin system endoribonuclease antitoxin GhoS n=1 Tax=Cronobacter sakazakii TaxID=28141 RepID=UPI001C0BD61B|nr:type V toxin-antitoxin system endoribonuclease antitoxin GhoS [Cronobacter sakazakii]ELY2798354.1 type V toxin-antitoxin system endoribonuclease antitoxin GhoS [Cronobacter dublinensis]ELY3972989.1 type V toxin-antitoxin system endoribonuclease antitoxin GhoS [Cronobacter dublinensis]ELY4483426.1 type V toxin-antitoxin system endoribonuclease antitoxin GhoS [Cronobacter dublinensis]ELY5825828.1 type V toxin-antitoxin system endoribonuclease antitoxin GhoS [Cronobacter dublinensis]QWR81952.1
MTNYTVRVELHYADNDDYEALHEEMSNENFRRTISIDGVKWELPTAEYSIVCDLTPHEILSKAQKAANKVQPEPEPSIIVTGSPSPRVFSGLKRAQE